MPVHKVINYDSGLIHWARASNDELAKRLPPEDVTLETWWHWRSICGKDLIARATEETMYVGDNVTCRACIKAYEAGRKKAEELAARFG